MIIPTTEPMKTFFHFVFSSHLLVFGSYSMSAANLGLRSKIDVKASTKAVTRRTAQGGYLPNIFESVSNALSILVVDADIYFFVFKT